MTGADTPSITVRQYGDAASIRSLITRQPDNTEFLLCWKGKYIVGITNVPAESHFNVRYEYDNNAVIAHDFFADDPYPGVLTIEASESSDPTPVADFETALRAFLQTVGVSNVALSHVTQLEWWNTNAAFYEVPLVSLLGVENQNDDQVLAIRVGNDVIVPTFKKNNVDCYMFYDNGRVNLEWEGAPSCPVTPSIFDDNLLDDSLLEPHETAGYSIVIDSCDTNDCIECRLVPNDMSAGLPTVRVRLYWRGSDPNYSLLGIFYWNSLKSIVAYGIPELTVGQSAGVVCNSVPCIVARTSESAASLKVNNIGAPNEYPYYQYLYLTETQLTLVSDALRLDDDSVFGQNDIVDSIIDAMPGVTVAVTRDSVSLDEMTRSFEV